METEIEPENTTSSPTATEEDIAQAEELKQQLDTLSESHNSLEQEYEASLRMLHEARLELRQLKQEQQQSKQQQSEGDGSGGSEEAVQQKQKQQMETIAKKL